MNKVFFYKIIKIFEKFSLNVQRFRYLLFTNKNDLIYMPMKLVRLRQILSLIITIYNRELNLQTYNRAMVIIYLLGNKIFNFFLSSTRYMRM